MSNAAVERTTHGSPTLAPFGASWLPLAAAIFLLVGSGSHAQDLTVRYDASSGLLPEASSPAWGKVKEGAGGAASFTAGSLRLSTGAQFDALSYEDLPTSVANPMIVEFRGRRVSGTTSNIAREAMGLIVRPVFGVGVHFFIGPDVIFLTSDGVRGREAAVDTDDALHTYRVEVSGTRVTVYYDGVHTLSGDAYSSPDFGGVPGINWGDFTNLASGVSEWAYVQHNSGGEGALQSRVNPSVPSIPADSALGTRLLRVAETLWRQGARHAAVDSAYRGLAIRERVFGRGHPDFATGLVQLAFYYKESGAQVDAEAALREAMTIQGRALPSDHAEVAATSWRLANLLQERGRYDEAEPLFRRTLQIRERALGLGHVEVAKALNNLANNCRNQGREGEAASLLLRALEIREQALGPDHADVAAILNNLAALYQDTGRYAEAEPLHQRALTLFEKALGTSHPYVAESMANLAELYQYVGRYVEAEPLLQRALEIDRRALGPGHPDVARIQSDLASVYEARGRYAEAESLLSRARAVRETALGSEHPEVGMNLMRLARVYERKGDHASAERLLIRARRIFETHLSPAHPAIGACLRSMGSLCIADGRYAAAESLFQQALQIVTGSLGPDHPDVASILLDMASCNEALGQPGQALTALSRAMWIEQEALARVFEVSSEATMRDYLGKVHASLGRLVGMACRNLAAVPTAADTALAWTLRRKTIVFETLIHLREAQRVLSHDMEVARLAGELRFKRGQWSRLVTGSWALPSDLGAEARRHKEACDRLEAQLNRRISEHLAIKPQEIVNLESVRKALPPGSVLLEVVQVRLSDARVAGQRSQSSHYIAFLLQSNRELPTLMVDLGATLEVDEQVRQFREAFAQAYASRGTASGAPQLGRAQREGADRENLFQSKSRGLYARVFAPLRKSLAAAGTIYLAPDGELNRVPFEALADGQAGYLIEQYRIAYLSSGRELLEAPAQPSRGTAVFAAPSYELGQRERAARAKLLHLSAPDGVAPSLRSSRPKDATSWRRWGPLPGARKEADDVRRELTGSEYGPVHVYKGNEAREEILKMLPAPRILHMATHGYFFPDQAPSLDGDPGGASHVLDQDPRFARVREAENPLLRSGIVLAGANSSRNQPDTLNLEDGWVTAEEIGMLDLRGTELVVLSACETGLGEVRVGEGVSGLRRAFRYAGARTLVMSLFQIDDEATRKLMRRFCQGLASGRGKLDALRQAQLEILRERREHSGSDQAFCWASFVLVGDPN